VFGAIINLINDERKLYMLSIYQLMKYLRNTHHINVKSSQTQALEIWAIIMDLRDIDLFERILTVLILALWMKL
jgi:hypothetical protein